MSNNVCWVVDCGEVSFDEILSLQKKLVTLRMRNVIPDVFLMAEHEPVITFGNRASESLLRVPRRVLEQRGIKVREIQRDGSIIFYMPGQIAGYAIRSLGLGQTDAHLAGIEESLLRTLSEYNINAKRGYEATPENKRAHGVWTMFKGKECKLGSIGVDVFQRITQYGFALNVNTRNEYFDFLEMSGKGATSIQRVIDKPVRLQEIKDKLVQNFANVFSYTVEKKSYLSFLDAVRKMNVSVSNE